METLELYSNVLKVMATLLKTHGDIEGNPNFTIYGAFYSPAPSEGGFLQIGNDLPTGKELLLRFDRLGMPPEADEMNAAKVNAAYVGALRGFGLDELATPHMFGVVLHDKGRQFFTNATKRPEAVKEFTQYFVMSEDDAVFHSCPGCGRPQTIEQMKHMKCTNFLGELDQHECASCGNIIINNLPKEDDEHPGA